MTEWRGLTGDSTPHTGLLTMQPLITVFRFSRLIAAQHKGYCTMPLLMGPVLSFRGCEDGNWNLSAVVVAKDNPGPLTAGGQAVQPEPLWEQKSGTAWRYRFGFPMAAGGTATYAVDGAEYQVRIPAAGEAPRMAYASCNGFSSL